MKKSYSYAELKGKLKVGMKVSADQGRSNCCDKLKDDGSNEVEITDVGNHYFFSIGNCWHRFKEEGFLMVDLGEPKTLQDLKAGDYIENEVGKTKILARIDDVVCVSNHGTTDDDSFYKKFGRWLTIYELEHFGYKPVTEPKEYSRDEIAKALNIKVEDLKIKDEK